MTYIKARPTIYKGIKMRSRLEASYAAFLDNRGADWSYEPQCFASENGQYLPDFHVAWPDRGCGVLSHFGGTSYVEVKPFWKADLLASYPRWLSIIRASDPHANLIVTLPHGDKRPAGWDCLIGPDLVVISAVIGDNAAFLTRPGHPLASDRR